MKIRSCELEREMNVALPRYCKVTMFLLWLAAMAFVSWIYCKELPDGWHIWYFYVLAVAATGILMLMPIWLIGFVLSVFYQKNFHVFNYWQSWVIFIIAWVIEGYSLYKIYSMEFTIWFNSKFTDMPVMAVSFVIVFGTLGLIYFIDHSIEFSADDEKNISVRPDPGQTLKPDS